MDKENQGGTFKRKLSKREKKEQKKKEKEKKIAEAGSAAEQLYTDMPETRFTRSISNPEAVMKRRRQQKVEKKLQQCRGQDGQGQYRKSKAQFIIVVDIYCKLWEDKILKQKHISLYQSS